MNIEHVIRPAWRHPCMTALVIIPKDNFDILKLHKNQRFRSYKEFAIFSWNSSSRIDKAKKEE